MGYDIKESVETVISHVPGSSGNFLGRLIAGIDPKQQKSFYRIDTDQIPEVVALNYLDLDKIHQHRIVVLHDFDKKILKHFPYANHIAIYPYSNIGNVLYNISTKKLTPTMENIKDQYYLQIKEWHNIILNRKPDYLCWDFKNLKDINFLKEKLTSLSENQINFFNNYWENQINYDLDILNKKQSMNDIVLQNNITKWFNDWSAIYVIYCYEFCNGIPESARRWSIDNLSLTNWKDLYNIEGQYDI